jgi:hypothetical protein
VIVLYSTFFGIHFFPRAGVLWFRRFVAVLVIEPLSMSTQYLA